jgi:HPt (histidine-containing phosphotransfer) domain-containing protein
MSSLDAAIAAIWERSKPVVAERLDLLTRAAEDPGDPARRDAGIRAAHQLAGSLGTFGLHDAGEVARAVEHELEGPADAARLADLSSRLRVLLAPRLS